MDDRGLLGGSAAFGGRPPAAAERGDEGVARRITFRRAPLSSSLGTVRSTFATAVRTSRSTASSSATRLCSACLDPISLAERGDPAAGGVEGRAADPEARVADPDGETADEEALIAAGCADAGAGAAAPSMGSTGLEWRGGRGSETGSSPRSEGETAKSPDGRGGAGCFSICLGLSFKPSVVRGELFVDVAPLPFLRDRRWGRFRGLLCGRKRWLRERPSDGGSSGTLSASHLSTSSGGAPKLAFCSSRHMG